MRECKDCHRELDENEFAGGTNWKQCKKCKNHQVLVRSYRRNGRDSVIDAWEQDGQYRWLQDYTKALHEAADAPAKRERLLRVRVRGSRRARHPRDSVLRRCWALVLIEHLDDLRVAAAEEWAAAVEESAKKTRACRARGNAKRRADRRENPERERAKDRVKRDAKPDLYRGLDAAKAARSRVRDGTVEKFPLNIVWLAAGGLCNICGEPCDKEWWHLDHIVPLAAGGAHMLENVAPAHPYCNLHKGARLNDTLDVEWLRATRAAWEASDAAMRLQTRQKSPCGTVQRYWKGCRCAECKEARTAHARARRVARPPKERVRKLKLRNATIYFDVPEYRALRREGVMCSVAAREVGISFPLAKRLDKWYGAL